MSRATGSRGSRSAPCATHKKRPPARRTPVVGLFAQPLAILDIDDCLVRALHATLLEWFARSKRDLPWRASRDPYRVWISEAMLQQTRVEVVIPYFARFLARFPDLQSLAAAPVEDVLAAWSGLGYYRRARALHAAAGAIVARHAGVFPRTRDELLALPGIGPYTAGAVASIAFDAPEPLVDGNVARVFARLFGLDLDPSSSAFQTAVWSRAAALVPSSGGAGDWNQALMELGATVCTPRDPHCAECPLRAHCRAFEADMTAELPRPKRRPLVIEVELVLLLVEDARSVLVERRPEDGRMALLWQLPTCEPSGARRLHPPDFPREIDGSALLAEDEPLARVRHTITRHKIAATVARGRWIRGEPALPLAWVARSDLGALGLTGIARKALRAVGVAAER